MSRRTPELLLEQLRRGELEPERAAAVRAALEVEPGGLERLAALDADDAETLKRYPPRVVAAGLRDRLARPRRRALGGLGLVAAAALALLALRPGSEVVAPLQLIEGDIDGVRLKGLAPRLQLHRLRSDGGVERLGDRSRAKPGDRLQLGYVAAGEAYGAVFSVDGNGVVTRHLPLSGDIAAALEGSGAHVLPDSYQLDDAPRFERFFLVASAEPFELQPLLDAAEGLPLDAPLPLSDELEAVSLTLMKAR